MKILRHRYRQRLSAEFERYISNYHEDSVTPQSLFSDFEKFMSKSDSICLELAGQDSEEYSREEALGIIGDISVAYVNKFLELLTNTRYRGNFGSLAAS